MSCTAHFLNLEWPHHHWKREVVCTQTLTFNESDMWGRHVDGEHVLCHARLVCEECGAVKDDGDCGCDPEEGAQCKVRLNYLSSISS